MTDQAQYTVSDARAAAADGRLEAWITEFLASAGSNNEELGQLLADESLWWLGPVLLPLDRLGRLAGPPGHPVVREVEDHEWRDDVADLADKVADAHEPAPVIARQDGDGYYLEDGNHRVEAVRQAGEDHVWAIVGFDSEAARDEFIARTAPT